MMSNNLRIWRLHTCSNEYTSLDSPATSGYFNHHFIAEPMAATWAAPEVTLSGKSKKLADIMGWTIGAVLLSQRAKLLLEPILGGCVEFLPFYEIKGKPYYAMNVLEKMSDILDVGNSDILFDTDEEKTVANVAVIWSAIFKNLPEYLPPIFKLKLRPDKVDSKIYVTKAFVDIVVGHQLTGIDLADPSKHSLPFILKGESQNVVLGVPVCGKKRA
jgi:hypothetical protein